MSFLQFPPFDVHADDNVGPRWQKYLTRFDRLMTAMDVKDPDRKCAMLLHFAGPDLDDIHQMLTIPAATDGNIYTRTTAALTSCFTPRSNTAFEIYTFRQARQGEGETIDAFATRQFAKSCEFADTEKEVANQIIFSCNSQSLRRRALREDYNLEQLLAAARIKRGTSSHTGKRQRSSTCELGRRRNGGCSHHLQLHRRRDSPPHRSQSRHRSNNNKMPDTNDRTVGKSRRKTGMCHYCGYDLPHRVCPARGKRCSACGKCNHFSQVCQSSGKSSKQDNGSVYSVQKDPQHFSDEDYDYSFSVNTREHDNILSTKNNSSRLPSCSVQIFGTPVLMTIYSGASVNIVDQSTYEQFPVMPSLRDPPRKVYTQWRIQGVVTGVITPP